MAFAGFPSRPKRKDTVDDVADDFSEFLLSAPARKIRRLDVDAPMIINQLEAESPMVFEDVDITSNSVLSCTSNNMAIVLYKPANAVLESTVPSGISFWVDKNLIHGIKDENKKFWCNNEATTTDNAEEEEASGDGRTTLASDKCLAVVPWLPAQIHGVAGSNSLPVEDEMDSGEDMDAMPMDVEEEAGVEQGSTQAIPMVASSVSPVVEPFQGLQQWQQQHCMYPNAPPNTTSAVTWSW